MGRKRRLAQGSAIAWRGPAPGQLDDSSHSHSLFALGAGLAATAAIAATPHFTGQELAGQAKITLAQARTIALKARPGTIVDQELEKEAGGSGLRYAFDVKAGKATYEVGVDAATGKVLENGAETAAQEAAEAKADKAAAHAKH